MPNRLTMSGNHQISLLVLLLILPPSESTIPKLNSIKDLKTIEFGQSVPAHSLLLLHWFANTIELDNNDAIELTFEADQGDYGTHHYGNYERVLNPLPHGHQYYTLGNLNHNNQRTFVRLPSYITDQINNLMVYEETNRDRIVFRLRNRNSENTIDQVYITQHYEANQRRGTMYDPEHTYQITTNLLRELRVFSLDQSELFELSEIRDHFRSGINDHELRSLRNKWGELACLGLLVFIVISEKNLPRKPNRARAPQPPKPNHQPKQNLPPKQTVQARATQHTVVNFPDYNPSHNFMHHPQGIDFQQRSSSKSQVQSQMTLEVKAGKNGKATVHWSGVPRHILQGGLMLVLYKNDLDTSRILIKRTREPWGSVETSVPLNKGLQVRLHKVRRFCLCFTRMGDEISRGPEYHNAHAETLVPIAGFDAKLNLFVKDGTACARLYIPEMLTDWKKVFRKSWVGFYTSERKQTNQYETWQWQWATKFVEEDTLNLYNVYEYHSSVAMAQGVHARFIDSNGGERARTPAWE